MTETAKQTLPERNCTDANLHDPHTWFSHVKKTQCKCNGDGVPGYTLDGGFSKGSTYATTTYTKKVTLKELQTLLADNSFDVHALSEDFTPDAARLVAFHLHQKQTDKAGEPYYHHLQAVADGVRILGGSDDEVIAAYFHDAVEDYHTTYKILTDLGVSAEARKMIEAVSKRTSEEQGKYLGRIIAAGKGAMRVKLADLLHNTRHDRLAVLKEETQTRLRKKYLPAIARLMLELNMIMDEDGQKKLATKPVGSATGTYYSTGSTGTKKSTTTTKSIAQKGGTVKTKPNKFSVAIDNMIRGDWPPGVAAPVLVRYGANSDKHVRYLLANGQYIQYESNGAKISVYALQGWRDNTHVIKEHAGMNIADFEIEHFLHMLS